MKRLSIALSVVVLTAATSLFTAEARPQYAQKENKECGYCHVDNGGGGARTFRGMFYGANKLSFTGYDEKRESSLAGVSADAKGDDSRPKIGYIPNISGPAAPQVQLASNRGPLVVVFFDSSNEAAKSAAQAIRKLAVAYGRKVPFLGVTEGDGDKALKLTGDLGDVIRVLPDSDGAALKKLAAKQGLDMVVVEKTGQTSHLISGVSKDTLKQVIDQLTKLEVEAPTVDLSSAPATAAHGGNLGG